ncbi:hypothetical protein [Vagococcus zengguangii]|uniref:Uncharacterized protein n=1 Tax=Vagococcus zengguangii TaxID=2571750 RepID=A0A4D7CRU6_9ENTE|nr:hypothetical protein [Vagococcus zengguangii]QCI85584.1 hypothetical protein FA707_00740 [Vagococcus zengguangii]TLG79439.1 hypothetical protein FE258_08815 [Vagococcus zengguangii]
MSFLKRLFRKETEDVATTSSVDSEQEKESWEVVPKYTEVTDVSELMHVSLVSSVLAAGDCLESHFKIKNIKQLNPEIELVTLIATAIATGAEPEKQFVVKSIKQKIQK